MCSLIPLDPCTPEHYLQAFSFSPLIGWVRVQRKPADSDRPSAHRRRTTWSSALPSSVTRWVSFTFPYSISMSPDKIPVFRSRSELKLFFSVKSCRTIRYTYRVSRKLMMLSSSTTSSIARWMWSTREVLFVYCELWIPRFLFEIS